MVQVSSMLKVRVLKSADEMHTFFFLFLFCPGKHAYILYIDLEEYGHLVVYFSAVAAFHVSIFSRLPLHPAWGQSPAYRLLIFQ